MKIEHSPFRVRIHHKDTDREGASLSRPFREREDGQEMFKFARNSVHSEASKCSDVRSHSASVHFLTPAQ